MAIPKLFNLARMSSATIGTGTITLGSAISGYLTFALAGVADGDIIAYGIKDGANSEVGTGTYTSAGTTLTRTVSKSTNSDTAISLTGAQEVFITARSQDFPTPFCFSNASLAVSAGSSALTIALKDNAGNDPSVTSPAVFWFRNATTTTGSWTALAATSAMSLVISSGSTMGVTTSTAFRIWVVMFNDAGTLRLGAINCLTASSTAATVFPLNPSIVASSTAEGGAGAADNAGVFYTGTAVSSKAFVVLGFLEWSATGLTAGTWTTTNLLYVQSMAADIKMPGSVVQRLMYTTTTGVTTSAAAYSTGLTGNITPTSAANIIFATSAGRVNQPASLTGSFVTLFRASTQLQSLQMFNGSGGQVNCVALFAYLDAPNATASTAYTIQIKSDGTRTMAWANSGDSGIFGTLILEEIQA